MGQQAEAEIQVIGDGVFIETTTGLEHGALDQLSVPPQFGHASIGQSARLDHRIQSHLHRLGSGQPIAIGINHGLAQLHRRPATLHGVGNKALEQVVLQLSIRIKHQQPLTFEAAQSGVERTRLAPTGIALAMDHIQSRVLGGQIVQQLRRPIKTAVVDHPGGDLPGRITQ
ncbi:MAG: hypothetical protein CM15mP116_06830 [Synechococcus sp.]|nr:MAG: hypothetical protein CM15mP116_06830 [Synechococcus sp.]